LLAEDQSRDRAVELLRAILDKEYKPFEIPESLLSKEGRIKVEVDRAGGGGGSSITNIDGTRVNPATSEKQANFSIPDFDEKIIDETDPDNTVITYKNGGSTVAVQTFAVVGAVTTITVV